LSLPCLVKENRQTVHSLYLDEVSTSNEFKNSVLSETHSKIQSVPKPRSLLSTDTALLSPPELAM